MKIRFFILSVAFFCSCHALYAQDTVVIDNRHYSNYEKKLQQREKSLEQNSVPVWSRKNLHILKLSLQDQGIPVDSALLFTSKLSDGQIRINSEKTYGYLDFDEIDSLKNVLEHFIDLKTQLPYKGEKTISYNARGNVYAACFVTKNTWRVVLTTQPSITSTYTYLNEEQVVDLLYALRSLSNHHNE